MPVNKAGMEKAVAAEATAALEALPAVEFTGPAILLVSRLIIAAVAGMASAIIPEPSQNSRDCVFAVITLVTP